MKAEREAVEFYRERLKLGHTGPGNIEVYEKNLLTLGRRSGRRKFIFIGILIGVVLGVVLSVGAAAGYMYYNGLLIL